MAISFSTFLSSTLLFFLFSSLTTAKTQRFARVISPSSLGLDQPQKLTHLHFFFHDVVGGRNQTAERVAASPATNKSPTMFGAVVMMDDPLTLRPDAASTLVGRAQGIYASASRTELGLLMAMNFAFTQGKYNGSSLAVLGRNTVESTVREMPVVGGSGLFRFARGYAQAKTHSFGMLEAIVEYNVYVFHY
ncbi:unnamed protein product [Sphenostylis stenocarpa]|uniref:Dirigent protein n=1 Tax=Sphenostylis stenocarpa TaxID=92480 RepID=A0AA86VQJ7_9FABA|nr:unnamed protein product [Sphenostylis stenocarpa]